MPHKLDLTRVIVVGHSAGGHLALWAAARAKVRAESAIATARPLHLSGAINLAGPTGLRENIGPYETECGDAVVTSMMGGNPKQVPANYSDASAATVPPIGVPQVLVWGEHERFVPRLLAGNYVQRARAAGDRATLRVIPGVGHFEIASPRSTAWPTLLAEIQGLLGRK